MHKYYTILILFICSTKTVTAQTIGNFVSVFPAVQNTNFVLPTTHKFQKIIEAGDIISNGVMSPYFDFTGFVPINNSSANGYLSINHEQVPGGITALDIQLDTTTLLWSSTYAQALNFNIPSIYTTARNCSGGITPWLTVISAEEYVNTADANGDGYYDVGWLVETNPATKTVVKKLWALGNGAKENITVHSNRRTCYFGNDAYPGYLYKFVADTSDNLSSGLLYAYSGSKNGAGNWVLIPNATITQRNTTMSLCAAAGATVFNGIEDVEIGPDGKIYFAVKNENRVYRVEDSDPITGTTTLLMETYVGNMSYLITHANGTTLTPWGTGNDNLAFDGVGNLWVLQDGGNNYIWVVMNGHTQASPQVKLFGISPAGSEPTGITFSPDYKYLFMSFQHPYSTNNIDWQADAAGTPIGFDKDIAIAIALNQNLGCQLIGQACNDNDSTTFNDKYDSLCLCKGTPIAAAIVQSITNSDNDAEELISTGVVTTTDSVLDITEVNNKAQYIGLRFENITIPSNAIITNAVLQFTCAQPSSDPSIVNIWGEKTVNSVIYNSSNNYDLSNRAKTNDSIAWSIPAWQAAGDAGADQMSPDIKTLIYEIMSQPGWQQGNPISIILEGLGNRKAVAHDSNPSASVKLIIEYLNPSSQNVGIGTNAPKSKLHIASGDVYLETPGTGIIMKSPDNNCWKITIDNNGLLHSTSIPCPN